MAASPLPPRVIRAPFPADLFARHIEDLTEEQIALVNELESRIRRRCAEYDDDPPVLDVLSKNGKSEKSDKSSVGFERPALLGFAGKRYLAEANTFRRYLVAREFKIDAAEELLMGTLEWLRDNSMFYLLRDPEVVASLSLEGETGKTYRFGKDKQGRPALYMRDRNQNTKNYSDQVRYMHYCLQMAVETMDRQAGVDQWVLIIDFNGQTMSNRPPMKTSRQVLDIMMERFPERLGTMFFVDAGWILNLLYKALKPFVSPATLAKMEFVSGSREKKGEKFLQYFDADQLEWDFGGEVKNVYSHEDYWNIACQDHEWLVELSMEAQSADVPSKKKTKKSKKKKENS